MPNLNNLKLSEIPQILEMKGFVKQRLVELDKPVRNENELEVRNHASAVEVRLKRETKRQTRMGDSSRKTCVVYVGVDRYLMERQRNEITRALRNSLGHFVTMDVEENIIKEKYLQVCVHFDQPNNI